MHNHKVKVIDGHRFGKGVLAIEDIAKGEVIAEFDGNFYIAEKATLLPNEAPDFVRNHGIQYGETQYRSGISFASFVNHSCDPNCGIKDLFKIVAMRKIPKGEEITWDYEMSEDSDWRMECECGSDNCRKVIGAYKNLPHEVKKKYKGFISEWLVKKYGEIKD